ncbi:MAG: AsmA family protein, partial [Pseudomonadota bacterium]|nr:AsmA family protein [Pseudomonadota bacterium]
ELTGINVLKGLGLLLAKQQQKAEIRCGIIDFKDHDGTLDTTTVYIDTSNVLITGRGHINLGSEAIELALAGDPKKFSILRLRSPIAVGGTMLHPTFGVQPAKLAGQAGAALALGTLLTPVAAALAFIDPGLAKDKDCSTVLAQAKAGVSN